MTKAPQISGTSPAHCPADEQSNYSVNCLTFMNKLKSSPESNGPGPKSLGRTRWPMAIVLRGEKAAAIASRSRRS